MKKSTVKTAKTAAPAKKAPVKIMKKTAAAPTKRAAAPAVKASSAKLAPTVITATADVGFGNDRGDAPEQLFWSLRRLPRLILHEVPLREHGPSVGGQRREPDGGCWGQGHQQLLPMMGVTGTIRPR